VDLRQRNAHTVESYGQVCRGNESGPGRGIVSHGIVEMLEGDRWSNGVFRLGVKSLGPNTKVAVTCGEEVEGLAVCGELRFVVGVLTVGNGHPLLFVSGHAISHRRNQNPGISRTGQVRVLQPFEADPTAVPGKVRVKDESVGSRQEIPFGLVLQIYRSMAVTFAKIPNGLSGAVRYFWARRIDPSAENPRGVQDSHTCAGAPPAVDTMNAQVNVVESFMPNHRTWRDQRSPGTSHWLCGYRLIGS
jgi:hypothetical protein